MVIAGLRRKQRQQSVCRPETAVANSQVDGAQQQWKCPANGRLGTIQRIQVRRRRSKSRSRDLYVCPPVGRARANTEFFKQVLRHAADSTAFVRRRHDAHSPCFGGQIESTSCVTSTESWPFTASSHSLGAGIAITGGSPCAQKLTFSATT